MTRRGISLLEILLALVLSAGLSVLILNLLAGAAARLRDRSERIGLAQTLRVAGEVLRAGLEDIGADSTSGTDLVDFGPDRIRYRATRLAGVVCDTAGPELIVRVSGGMGSARRQPQPGRDSALVLEVDTAQRWHPAALSNASGQAPCPFGGSGIRLALSLDSIQRSTVGPGSIVRVFETMEARRYSSGGLDWLGLQSVSAGEAIQPLAGPLAAANGLGVRPETAAGVAAASPGGAEAVRLDMRARTIRDFGVGLARAATAWDSLPVYVFFRNQR